jgi:hypothetical protein
MVRQALVEPPVPQRPENRFSTLPTHMTPWIDGLISAEYL